jgi:hypothetical protein
VWKQPFSGTAGVVPWVLGRIKTRGGNAYERTQRADDAPVDARLA